MEDKLKIVLGVPTNRKIKPKTALSILRMIVHCKHEYQFIVSTKGYNTAENRNYISTQAVNKGCTHLLLLDDDMIYEPDSLNILLAHNKDVVGATYSVREGTEKVIEYLDDKRPDTLFKCKALGGGLLLIKTSVFKKVPQPWFGYKWYENGMVKMSNDWFFCEKARENGFDIYCDPKLTAQHIGEHEY